MPRAARGSGARLPGFRLTGEPSAVDWFTEGRPATRAEIEAAIVRGLPALEALCRPASDDSAVLTRYVERARKYLPVTVAGATVAGPGI